MKSTCLLYLGLFIMAGKNVGVHGFTNRPMVMAGSSITRVTTAICLSNPQRSEPAVVPSLPERLSSWWNSANVPMMCTTGLCLLLSQTTPVAWAVEGAAGSNAKLLTGGASTLQSGRTISITRGVNLDNADFANQNLKGVAFQQSIVRDADFRNSNLQGASFFDATLDGSNFENAYVACILLYSFVQ
jgi:hypothetical protein